MTTDSPMTPPLEQDIMPRTDLRKHYENMTYDEMTRHMQENYKQINEMLGNRLSMLSVASEDQGNDEDSHPQQGQDEVEEVVDAHCLVAQEDLSDAEKTRRMTQLFTQVASRGDVERVKQYLQDKAIRTYVDINARDDDGTTPLIYAACFGRANIAQVLLDAGANVNIQDGFGWTALMWATNNNHDSMVKMLLTYGASAQTRTATGRTALDFASAENHKMVEILSNPRDSVSSVPSLLSSSSSSSNVADCDFYYQSTREGYDTFMNEEADRRQQLIESALAMLDAEEQADGRDDADNLDTDADNLPEDDAMNVFLWDRCLPDQMFVFSADDLDHLLRTVITDLIFPLESHDDICVPVNVIFLSARFAHYFSCAELLHDVLDGAIVRIHQVVKRNIHNVHSMAFWITNCMQLLYYLKKDTGLVVATAEYQLRLSELISETYSLLIADTEQRMAKVLGPAILDFEAITGMEDITFSDDWQRFFRRSMTMTRSDSQTGYSLPVFSPRSITSLLTNTLDVLQSYEVHPTITIQALAQCFHFISCEIFNRILANKKLLCRSKALQIRLNVSHIEDWVRHHQLPSCLITYLSPTTQLLQLLQCLTQLNDLEAFETTVQKCDSLNALQVRRCVTNYRYETNELRLSDDIEAYATQLVEETVRCHHQRRNRESTTSTAPTSPLPSPTSMSMSRGSSAGGVSLQRTRSTHTENVSQLVGSLIGIAASASMPSAHPVAKATTKKPVQRAADSSASDNDDDDDDDEEDSAVAVDSTNEKRDSKFMLPFSVPTTAHMVYTSCWSHKTSQSHHREHQVVPVIPDAWMEKLDKSTLSSSLTS